jgi:hypothetical protein
MPAIINAGLFAFGAFLAIVVALELGRRIGLAQLAADPEGARTGTGAVDAAIYGLLGLLIAFTFSGAATRFEARRDLIRDEANATGTAYLRLDLLPAEAQGPLKEKFRQYLDSRLAAHRKLPDVVAARAELGRSVALQGEIWRDAVAALRLPGAPAPVAVLPPINDMIDITTTRLVGMQTHPPTIIFALLGAIALVSGMLAGYGMASGQKRNLLHMLVYATVMAGAVYVIMDLEYPRGGLIRIDAADQTLVDVRNGMK